MKFLVISIAISVFIVFKGKAQTSTPCSEPPGGEITCSEDQNPVCEVDKNGRVHGKCIDTPKSFESITDFFEKVVGTNSSWSEYQIRKVLQKGEFDFNGKKFKVTLNRRTKEIMF